MAMAMLPPEHPVTVLRDRKWPGERPEIRVGIVIASPRDSDVFGNYGVPFLLELLAENLLQCLEADAHHAETSANRKRVLGHLVPCDVGELRDGQRAEFNAFSCDSGFDRVGVIYTGNAPALSSLRWQPMASWLSGISRSRRSPMLVTFSGPVRIVRKVWPPRMIDGRRYKRSDASHGDLIFSRRCRGVATPCPAAPPMPKAKVRFIAIS